MTHPIINTAEGTDSVIVGVCNRNQRLYDAIENWLDSPYISDITVVDWGSSTPIQPFSDGRTTLVRVNEQYWRLAHAYNLAAKFARGPVLCKLDVDYRISSDFLAQRLEPGTFWRGDSSKARPEEPEDRFLNGFVRVFRDDFWRVNGYNELMNGYGYDDTDLYARLVTLGLTSISVRGGPIIHLAHDWSSRGVNASDLRIGETNRQNELIAKSGAWQSQGELAAYQISCVGPNHYIAERR